MIIQVLKTHPYILNGNVLMQNPHFEDPAKWLAENAPQFLSDNGKIIKQFAVVNCQCFTAKEIKIR